LFQKAQRAVEAQRVARTGGPPGFLNAQPLNLARRPKKEKGKTITPKCHYVLRYRTYAILTTK
jgi:hypothetical protein